jgi:hypothetical protein
VRACVRVRACACVCVGGVWVRVRVRVGVGRVEPTRENQPFSTYSAWQCALACVLSEPRELNVGQPNLMGTTIRPRKRSLNLPLCLPKGPRRLSRECPVGTATDWTGDPIG